MPDPNPNDCPDDYPDYWLTRLDPGELELEPEQDRGCLFPGNCCMGHCDHPGSECCTPETAQAIEADQRRESLRPRPRND